MMSRIIRAADLFCGAGGTTTGLLQAAQGLVRPVLVEAGGERWWLDILFRMLTVRELAAAHSFPASYWFAGNKSEQVKQIGNSVPVATAEALCRGVLSA